MKKYNYTAYISATMEVEVLADNEAKAYEIAKGIVERRSNAHLLDNVDIEIELTEEEKQEDTCEYADMMLDAMRGN